MATNLLVEDYGPSDTEFLYEFVNAGHFPNPVRLGRVRQVLRHLHEPDLVCGICWNKCSNELRRASHGAPSWHSVCPECDADE